MLYSSYAGGKVAWKWRLEDSLRTNRKFSTPGAAVNWLVASLSTAVPSSPGANSKSNSRISRAIVVRRLRRANGLPMQLYVPDNTKIWCQPGSRARFGSRCEDSQGRNVLNMSRKWYRCCNLPVEKGAKAPDSRIISGREYQRSGMNFCASV